MNMTMSNQLSKYFNSSTAELMRSQIKPSSYNPRLITDEGRKALKRSIKLYGVVGGIVVNKRTGYTIVGGHQKVSVLDELQKYNPETKANDYSLRVELVDIDEKTEKQLNITLNNPNVGGDWDYDALRELIPDIDYRDAGLTDVDLNLIGCDYMLQTDDEAGIADAIADLTAPIEEMKKAQREQEKAQAQAERVDKVAHMKEVKAQVQQEAEEKVKQMEAYVMLSFDTFENKTAFCQRFGYDPYMKIIKGEVFDGQVERIE